MDKQIYLGKHLLHGTNHFGQWVTEAIEGWDEPPAVREAEVERTNTHGSFDLPSYYAARTPTLDGILFSDSRAQALQGLYALNANARLTAETLTVTDAGRSQWARVKLAGLDHTWITNRAFRWQLRLKAPDPRKFGEVRDFRGATGESIRTFHRGNYGATPLIYVNGNMPGGYRMICNGQTVTVPVAAVEGVWHSINFRTRRLRVNGVVRLASFTDNGFWTVPPGQNADVVITPLAGGSGVATINVTDTYI